MDPCLRQVHTGELFRGFRLYTRGELGVQSLTRRERRSLRIGGEKTAYLDFSGCVTRMMYHVAGIDPDPAADVYRPEQVFPKFYASDPSELERNVVRDLVKRTTNICWNVPSRFRAKLAVEKAVADDDNARFLRSLMRDEGLTAWGLVRQVVTAHPDLAEFFFRPDLAEQVGWVEGMVMLKVLLRFVTDGRPAMSFHDAVLCRRSDAGFARKEMRQVYHDFLGYYPVIKRD